MMFDHDPTVEFLGPLDPRGLTAGPPCPLCGNALTAALMRREPLPCGYLPPQGFATAGEDPPRRLELEPCGCRVRLGGTTIPEVEVHKDTGHLRSVRLDRREAEVNVYFRVLHVPDDPVADRTRIQVEGGA